MNIDEEDHLDGVRVAAFLDARLDAAERRKVEAHLEGCDRCRHEVIQVSRLMPGEERPAVVRTRGRLAVIGALVAAAVVMLAILQPFAGEFAGPPVRAVAEGTGRLEAIAPAAGSSVGADAQFVWRAAGEQAVYRVRLTDRSGRVVATINTTDTNIRIPVLTDLEQGATYYWHVDALLDDGSSATTGHQSFQVQR